MAESSWLPLSLQANREETSVATGSTTVPAPVKREASAKEQLAILPE